MTTEGQLCNDAQEGGALNDGSAGQAKDDAHPTSAGTPEEPGGRLPPPGRAMCDLISDPGVPVPTLPTTATPGLLPIQEVPLPPGVLAR